MKFLPIVIWLLLSGLFIYSLIQGAVTLAALNSPNQTIANAPVIRSLQNDLNDTLIDFYDVANETETSISGSPLTLTSGSGGIIVDAIGTVWKSIKITSVLLYNLTLGFIFSYIFGSQTFGVVIGVISGLVILTIVFAVWKMLSQGDAGESDS